MADEDSFILRFQIVSPLSEFSEANLKTDGSENDSSFPYDVLSTMADRLNCPDDGNVEFRAKTLTGETKSLYAHKVILSKRCDYYKTSHLLQDISNNCSV
jgi:hypothetical protein